MFKKGLLVLVLLSLAACSSQTVTVSPPAGQQIDSEEQAVYAVLFRQMFPGATSMVLRDTTATDAEGIANTEQTLQYVLQNMHAVSSQTAASFKSRNATATTLKADMDLGVSYVLLSQDEMNQIFSVNQDGWQVFYEKYPQAPGILTLSRVGFNAGFNQALVYLGAQSAWLSGSGQYILLKKQQGVWTIDQKVMTWIS